MALNTEISAKYFSPISTVGQSSGFQDFTQAELSSDGNIQTITRTFDFDVTVLSGITNPVLGMEYVVNATEIVVTDYLNTVFTDPSKTYNAKIYILNVKRLSTPISGVSTLNNRSPYVDRFDVFYVDVRINVEVV